MKQLDEQDPLTKKYFVINLAKINKQTHTNTWSLDNKYLKNL